jgi:CubicO group peptidase (beta-lactamase class C family)
MARLVAVAVVTWLLSAAGHASDVPDVRKVVPQDTSELAERLRAVLRETRTPGLGVALTSRDAVLWQAGLGKADVGRGLDASPDTLFRIGSISKTFVSLAVLMLVEEGRLSLEAPVRTLVPDVAFENPWEATDPVRLVHVLEHTSGFDDLSLREYALNDPSILLPAAFALRPASRTSRWRPGTRMSYCNSGPPIAARAVETVTGERFESFVGKRIFTPLGMATASYFKDPATDDRRALLYRGDGVTPYPYWHIVMRPSGAINASASEMARFVRLLLGRGTFEGRRLVQPESIQRMEHPTTTYAARAGLEAGYGLGNYATLQNGFVFHGHDGGVEGGLAKLEYLPEAGLGFVLMINGGSGKALGDAAALVRNYLTRDLVKPAVPAAVTLSPGAQDAARGYWRLENPRQEVSRFLLRLMGTVRVDARADGISLRGVFGGDTDEYVPVTERLFRPKDNAAPSLVLVDTPEGHLLQQSNGQSFRRVPAAVVALELGLATAALALLLSAPLFALVWLPRRLLGGMRGVRHLRARILPLVASLLLFASAALLVGGFSDPFRRLGAPTAWSVGFAVLSFGFAVAAAVAAVVVARAPIAEQNRWAAWHSRLVTVAAVLVAGYLGWFGLIGYRTWV